ncbi:MAG: uroporphyrinogen decarboxylase family protein [Phycisphaerales bacterium]
MFWQANHQPDFSQFLKVLTRTGRPSHLPSYEHIASGEFIDAWTGKPFCKMPVCSRERWRTYIDFWMSMGFDCVPLEIPLNCPRPVAKHAEGGRGSASEERVVIRNTEDFERYAWPSESAPIDFAPFEIVSELLPDGAKIVGGVCMGPYEWASSMLGTEGMSFALVDQPELVRAVFKKLGDLIVAADKVLAQMDGIGALRQGDDLGFRTSTFLSPDLLREMVFPIYRRMTDVAHAAGKPFVLHSCGQLAAVYDDLIDTCRIDAKHSFEEAIMPVEQFKAKYGRRVTPLGGLDVDMICRGSESQIHAYTRDKIEKCFADGHWAIGTGNSLTDYMPIENYKIVLEEARRIHD